MNTINSNIITLADFCNQFATKISYLIEAIFIFIILLHFSINTGFIIFLLSIIVFLAINLFNKLIATKSNIIQNKRDGLSENFVNIVEGKKISTNFNISNELQDKYFSKVNEISNTYNQKLKIINWRDNWLYLFYSLIIFCCTIFLIKQVESNQINLSLYLILTPYLTSFINKTVSFFDIIRNIQNVNISSLRIKTIQEMKTEDLLSFGNNLTNTTQGELIFNNVSYMQNQTLELRDFNFRTKPNSISLIQGIKNCGKRNIFKMLTRSITPSKGTITLDGINIYDFDSKIYSKNISFTCNNPPFFTESILENLKYIEKSKKNIISTCKETNIHQTILKLPNGYQTILNQNNLSTFNKFLLGLTRCVLSQAEVILIYEIPASLTIQELKILKDTLIKLRKNHSIIIFSALDNLKDISNQHIVIENGEIVMNKNSENKPN